MAWDWLLGSGGKEYKNADASQVDQARLNAQSQMAGGRPLEAALARQTLDAQYGQTGGQALLRQGTNEAIANQTSTAASARGGAMALAGARNQAAVNAVAAQGQAANQAALLKAQEIQQAFGAQTGYQLGREQSYNQALGAEMQKYGADQQMAMAKAKAESERTGKVGQMVGAGLGAAASIAMLSDERAKVDAGPPSQDQLVELLRSQEPHVYRYDGQPAGTERLGVMAQDLEQSDLGRALVSEGADGLKRIDTEAALSALLAEMGAINARIDDLGAKSATVRKGGA